MKPSPLSKRDKKRIRDAAKFAADMDGDTLTDRLVEATWAAGSRIAISVAEGALLNVLAHEVKHRLAVLAAYQEKYRLRR